LAATAKKEGNLRMTTKFIQTRKQLTELSDERLYEAANDYKDRVRLIDYGNISNQNNLRSLASKATVMVLHYLGMSQSFNGLICTEDHRLVKKITDLGDVINNQISRLTARTDALYPEHVRNCKFSTKDIYTILTKKNISLISQLINMYILLHRSDYKKKIDLSAFVSAWTLIVSHSQKTNDAYKLNSTESSAAKWVEDNDSPYIESDRLSINEFFWLCLHLIDKEYLPDEVNTRLGNKIMIFYSPQLKAFISKGIEQVADPIELGFPRTITVRKNSSSTTTKRKVI